MPRFCARLRSAEQLEPRCIPGCGSFAGGLSGARLRILGDENLELPMRDRSRQSTGFLKIINGVAKSFFHCHPTTLRNFRSL
jgi:hypothetical protein